MRFAARRCVSHSPDAKNAEAVRQIREHIHLFGVSPFSSKIKPCDYLNVFTEALYKVDLVLNRLQRRMTAAEFDNSLVHERRTSLKRQMDASEASLRDLAECVAEIGGSVAGVSEKLHQS